MMDRAVPYEEMLNELPIPVLLLANGDGRISFGNSAAEQWFGRSSRGLKQQELSIVTQSTALLSDAIERVKLTTNAVNLFDISIHKAGSDPVLCHVTLFPYREHVGLILRGLMQQVSRDNANDSFAVEALGRMLAHELKNPLAGIKGAAQLLRTENISPDAEELISLIVTETDRIARLTESMSDFGQLKDLSMGRVNIHATLRQSRLLIQSTGTEVKFTENYDPSLPDVRGDADSLMQVTLNLMKNAVEAIAHSGQGDEIIIETAFRAGITRTSAEAAFPLPIEIKIIDNGPGISSQIRHQLFQPFVTNKPAGQGLGLTLASRLIAAHDGLIEVQSRPGRTVFSLLLPAFHP